MPDVEISRLSVHSVTSQLAREELNFDRERSASFTPSQFLDGPAQISFRPPLKDCTLSGRNKDKIATPDQSEKRNSSERWQGE